MSADASLTLPQPMNWNDTQDTIALLTWLQAQPPLVPARTLPGDAYKIEAADLKLRALSGLLAAQPHIGEDPQSIALIHKLLLTANTAQVPLLLSELERIEARQRENSQTRLRSWPDHPSPPEHETAFDAVGAQPYIAITSSDEGDYSACFAVEVAAVHPISHRLPLDEACGELLVALHQAWEHAQNQYGLGLEMRLAWRCISQDQALTMALLMQMTGCASETEAEHSALGVWQTVESLLPLKRGGYVYQPVTEAARWAWLHQPCEIASLFSIVRQTQQFTYESKPIYTVLPIGSGDGSRQSLLAEMLRRPGVQMVDIHLKPTRWSYDERELIGEMLRINGADVSHAELLLHQFSDERLRRAWEIYTQALNQEMMFEVHVSVASSEPSLSSSLPLVAAQALFGTSRYEIVSTVAPDAMQGAVEGLRTLTPPPPAGSNAPRGLERLLSLWTPLEALAAVRLPHPNALGLPGVPLLKVKQTALPPGLPTEGLLMGDAYDPMLGRTVPVYLSQKDRARHVYVVGRTGTGKTTLLENMALQDIRAGRGVGIIDPHGDLIEAVLARIPPQRAEDVILFDPGSTERTVGLNILDVTGDFEKNMVISEFMGLMYSIYDPGRTGIIGPRFEQAVRNAMHVAMAVKDSTLMDVMRILSNRSYMQTCLKFVSDPVAQAYWNDIADGQSDFHRSEVLDYITSKFGRFTGDTTIRRMIGQSKTSINFERVMDERKILLVNLSKGHIGQENSRFLGLLLVPRLLIAAFSRAKQSASQRQPFYLYIDEFHNFTTPMLSTMLSEGRKYGLALTLANQFVSQLKDEVREAVFGNIGTIGTFQVGVNDAQLIEQELYPVFNHDDLVNVPAFHMALKMPTENAPTRPFMLKTRASTPHANAELAEAIRHHTLLHYGRSAVVTEAEIRRRFQQPPEPRV